jgi:hypothetical protein
MIQQVQNNRCQQNFGMHVPVYMQKMLPNASELKALDDNFVLSARVHTDQSSSKNVLQLLLSYGTHTNVGGYPTFVPAPITPVNIGEIAQTGFNSVGNMIFPKEKIAEALTTKGIQDIMDGMKITFENQVSQMLNTVSKKSNVPKAFPEGFITALNNLREKDPSFTLELSPEELSQIH